MKQYINPEKSKTFKEKTKATQELINTTLYILECFGIPMDSTPRRLERMAIRPLHGSFTNIIDINN